jgi:hypothetical protein
MRAALVPAAAATLGIVALGSLSPTTEPTRASTVHAASFGGPSAVPVVHEPVVLAR